MYKFQKKYANAQAKGIQLIGDKVIRKALFDYYNPIAYLEEVHFPHFIADMVLISPKRRILGGFEIKSDRDELTRLAQQLRGYIKYINEVWVVTTYLHLGEALNIINSSKFENVGLLLYKMTGYENTFEVIKKAKSAEIKGVDKSWITSKNQLKQWDYLLDEIWGE